MSTRRTVCPFSCLLMMAIQSGFASEGLPPVLNPKTYCSPSGVYSLIVDPTDLYGRGPADYRFTKDGKTVWARRLPYSLWQASVADSGQVAGYAYTYGWRGFSEGGWDAGPGNLIVALLSAEGRALNEEKHTRQWSRFPDSPPDSLVSGTVLDASNKRFIVRVDDADVNRHIEQWWVYDVESGKRMATLEPGRSMPDKKGDETLYIVAAQAISGTPLVLTHWWKYASGKCGGVFTLVDLNDTKGKPVWSLHLDGDYSVSGNDKAEDTVREKIRRDGAILDSKKPFEFAIHAVKQRERLVFSIEKAGDGTWRVRETTRNPYDFPSSKSSQEDRKFPQIKLEEVAVVQLSGTGTRNETPIRDLRGFGFDADGKICVLTFPKSTEPHLVYLTQQGAVLKDLPVPVGKFLAGMDVSNPANVGGHRFVVAVSEGGEEGTARCFVADFDTASIKEMPGFRSLAVKALAGFPDGRFAALVYHRMKYTVGHGLSFFDAEGKPLWQKEYSGYAGKPEELLSPHDITRYGDDSIAVLDVIRHTIQFFDTKCTFLRSINLNETWKREPRYPTNITEDLKGGFAVYDFNAQNSLVRMDAKGMIQSQCVPKFSDGRPVKVVYGVRRSPEGRLWTTDGDVLLRLSDGGIVDQTLGEEAALGPIYEPSYAAVGPKDRVYVADGRTHAVHVFDGNGKREGMCVPDPKDLIETSYVQHIAESADDNVFVSLGRDDDSYIRFDANLKRAGTVRIDLDSVSQDWHFPPSGPLCWVCGYQDIFLVKDLRSVVRKISRRADGRWLESPSSIGVAPDGSAAVVATSRSGEVSVNTYGPTGDPRATFVGPEGWYRFGRVAYDGQSAFFQNENEVCIIGPDNNCIGSFRLPLETADDLWQGPFIATEGKQLWFVDLKRLRLHKYAIPHSKE